MSQDSRKGLALARASLSFGAKSIGGFHGGRFLPRTLPLRRGILRGRCRRKASRSFAKPLCGGRPWRHGRRPACSATRRHRPPSPSRPSCLALLPSNTGTAGSSIGSLATGPEGVGSTLSNRDPEDCRSSPGGQVCLSPPQREPVDGGSRAGSRSKWISAKNICFHRRDEMIKENGSAVRAGGPSPRSRRARRVGDVGGERGDRSRTGLRAFNQRRLGAAFSRCSTPTSSGTT